MDARALRCLLPLVALACVPEIIEAPDPGLGDDSGTVSGESGEGGEADAGEGQGDDGGDAGTDAGDTDGEGDAGDGDGEGDAGEGDAGEGDAGEGDGDGDGDGDTGDGDGDAPACTSNDDCPGALCLAGECETVVSCKQLDDLDLDDLLPSGVYPLDPDGEGPEPAYLAYCELELMGGGWTLVLKSNGNLDTFVYDSPQWASDQPFEAQFPGLDRNEAKLPSYSQVAVSEVLIEMEYPIGVDPDPLAVNYLLVPWVIGPSLHALVAPGEYIQTEVGREGWKSLVQSSSLQPNCNREGLNVKTSNNAADHHVRIGIVANEQNDCNSPNSRLGIGGFGDKCGAPNLPTGNFAGCQADNGDQVLPSFAWVFVR